MNIEHRDSKKKMDNAEGERKSTMIPLTHADLLVVQVKKVWTNQPGRDE